MKVEKVLFDHINDQNVYEYIIETENMFFSFINFGARIHKVMMLNNHNQLENIILSLNTVDDYINSGGYFGATVGRVAGRINRGMFTLNGEMFQLECNDRNNHLHGGRAGLDSKIWDCEIKEERDKVSLIFTTFQSSIEDGYPGNMNIKVIHTIEKDNQWTIRYEAETDNDTIFNPTNHVYFNLNGNYNESILNHELKLNNQYFIEINKELIPTGEVKHTENFDFSQFKLLKDGIVHQDDDNQLVDGYDHPFLLNGKLDKAAIELKVEEKGRKVVVYTDQPSVVIYTSNMMDYLSSDGVQLKQYCGVTLETQNIPDAINHDNFGNIILKKGETFSAVTTYSFQKI